MKELTEVMNVTALKRIITEKRTELYRFRLLLNELIKSAFPLILKEELFDKFPYVQSVGWTQYTPYLRDKETSFYINSFVDNIEINHIKGGDRYKDKWGSNIKEKYTLDGFVPNPDYDVRFDPYCILSDLLEESDEEAFQTVYGDHVKVTIYSNGQVKTAEHDHD